MNGRWGFVWLAGYAGSIVLANWLITRYGIVPIGFGLTAPAGVFAAGLAFTFRDLTHEAYGRWGALAAIGCGAALSWWISPAFAVASGLAFLVSELSDFAVYAPLRERRWLLAVTLSNTVGLLVDSALFLWLAFGSLQFLAGQVVGKAYMTALAVIAIGVYRIALSQRPDEQGA